MTTHNNREWEMRIPGMPLPPAAVPSSELTRLQAIAVVAVTLADAALAYDQALAQYGRQIDAGNGPAFVDSDHLDRLYLDWLGKAHALKALIG